MRAPIVRCCSPRPALCPPTAALAAAVAAPPLLLLGSTLPPPLLLPAAPEAREAALALVCACGEQIENDLVGDRLERRSSRAEERVRAPAGPWGLGSMSDDLLVLCMLCKLKCDASVAVSSA